MRLRVRVCVDGMRAGGCDEKNEVEWRKKNLFLRLERFIIEHPHSHNIFVQRAQRTPPSIWLRQEKVSKKKIVVGGIFF